ncbi:MAG: phosphate acetyltransferase [Desulfamplus sp.]|nr:phosphate acetyltransferase [Desulfamplus sp.]MBF0390295.1 phosphate acetyltransferase [Desulfamplus sp.]
MANNIYITATGPRSGKTVITIGVMELLLRKMNRVGFFRPIVQESDDVDKDITLISTYFDLKFPINLMYGITAEEATELASHGRQGEVIETIINKYNQLKERCDFIVCEGTDSISAASSFEFDINAEISKNLSSSVLLVASGHRKTVDETVQSVEIALASLRRRKGRCIGIIITRVEPLVGKEIIKRLSDSLNNLTDSQTGDPLLIYAIAEEPSLSRPTIIEIAKELDGTVLWGKNHLNRHVHGFNVAAMQLRNILPRIEHGDLIITSGDRADVIVACIASALSSSRKNIAGLLLTGGLVPSPSVAELINGFADTLPIVSVQDNTFPAATKVNNLHAGISPFDKRKITRILATFEKHVNTKKLAQKVITTRTTIRTPKMFELELIQRARANRQHIVLPEGEEERILRASEILLRREVVDITLLGNQDTIYKKIKEFGLRMDSVNIINPPKSEFFDEYIQTYYALREHKGITPEYAHDMMKEVNEYATMMIFAGHADGMVSGSIHSTAATIRPALQILSTKPDCSIVSSVMFMCLEDRVLVYGDCAINPEPNAEELAEIAITSAQTAAVFDIEPVVAMLSYSTGSSGKGKDVDKVRQAAEIARQKAYKLLLNLKIEGPIQYDAAVDASVAKTKLPNSQVAGAATIFIFPDLNTGNNTYKAVQRSSGAVAVGPVLQGLRYPVNDLSRGCTVTDIVNTVAITAIQAQSQKGIRYDD